MSNGTAKALYDSGKVNNPSIKFLTDTSRRLLDRQLRLELSYLGSSASKREPLVSMVCLMLLFLGHRRCDFPMRTTGRRDAYDDVPVVCLVWFLVVWRRNISQLLVASNASMFQLVYSNDEYSQPWEFS